MEYFMRQNRKFLVLISLLIIAGFLITSLASFFVSRRSLRQHISEMELPLTSDNIYSEIQRDLLRPIFISSLMAQDTFLRDWVLKGEQNPGEVIKYLKEIQQKYNAFTAFFVSDKTLNYYYPDGILKKVRQDSPRDDWYFRVRNMEEDYEINVDVDMGHDDALTIFINYRVYDYQGNFIGATGVGLNVFAVRTMIREYQEQYGCTIHFVDAQGSVTLHGELDENRVNKLSEIKGIEKIEESILKSEATTYKYKYDGNLIHLYVRYIPEFDWYLLVGQSEEKTVANIYRTLLLNILFLVIITVVVLLLTTRVIMRYNRRLERMARLDRLTGASNRYAFDELIPVLIQDVQNNNVPFSIILIDLDYFKTINDEYGHAAGDRFLSAISEEISRTIRDNDILFRWGGEEFLVVLQKCTLENAIVVAEKIRKGISEKVIECEGKDLSITASMGVAEFVPGEPMDSMIQRADSLLYKAKEKGRNCVVSTVESG